MREPHPMPLAVRAAQPGEGAALLRFVKELAAHEGRPQDVTATAEEMERQLFLEKAADALFAAAGGEDVGYAIFYPVYRSFGAQRMLYVEDMYITPACRGKGYGRALFAHLAAVAKGRGCAGMCWSAVAGNAAAIGFYAAMGAVPEEGVAHFSIRF